MGAEKILDTIQNNGQIVLQYCDSAGKPAGYPFDPNGSCRHIAGITDATGRIFGLMPHPERFIFKHHWPHWKEGERPAYGLKIFENSVAYFT
ncbi:MAG: phosphoribosylformylglycinamidine synthase subunit PurQ, partial [Candidatus Omnitrophica bacterium]|nr:phosphoribosylformylglycinamidine synthase subunit PurQ [Candidatus Omnitrophota bacterium]